MAGHGVLAQLAYKGGMLWEPAGSGRQGAVCYFSVWSGIQLLKLFSFTQCQTCNLLMVISCLPMAAFLWGCSSVLWGCSLYSPNSPQPRAASEPPEAPISHPAAPLVWLGWVMAAGWCQCSVFRPLPHPSWEGARRGVRSLGGLGLCLWRGWSWLWAAEG